MSKPKTIPLTKETLDNTKKGEECSYCGNRWEVEGKCTTCWEDKKNKETK